MRSALVAAANASSCPPPRLAGALLRTQPDSRLAQLAGEGSEPAFEEIVRRYRSGLVAFAAKISSRDSADDVVQDSMVKAHSALLRGDRPDAPRAWLFRIVRNTALNDRRDHPVHEHLDESHDGVEQPPEVADRRRQLRALVLALRNLPRAQREALVQREMEGRGHDEIAADLDVSPGAVRQLIFRARSALRAGFGALLPVQLLRAAVLSGATEQAGSGAAATGAGIAAKLGMGALLTTGALVAGTHTVKDEAPPATRGQHATATVARDRARTAPTQSIQRTGGAGVAHRRQVIVAPRTVSTQRASTPPASTPPTHVPAHSPQSAPGVAGPEGGSAPPPAGPSGAGGGQTDGGARGAQNYSATSPRDCQSDGARDPAPSDVSPG
jgi:RNA polymerase sigma factor (sigma-70 family)